MNNFKSIPFYCSCHNRDLINAYNAFTTQIDQVLEEIDPQKVADRHDHRGEYYHEAKKDNNLPVPIPIFPCENCNKISNLTHPEFNFTTKLTSHEDKVNENTDKEVFPTNKFFYDQDESFNLVLGTFPNEYNFNLNDNLSHLNFENLDQIQTKDNYEDVSEPFYNFFKKDMDKYQRTGKTDLTSSDLKELKEFFVNVLKVYKNFDTDFETFYEDIKDHLK